MSSSNMKWKFEPSDFVAIHKEAVKNGYASYNAGDMWEPSDTLQMLVDAANAKLDEWRREATVVYSEKGSDMWAMFKMDAENATHRALLIDIEEIPKEPCKHSPKPFDINVTGEEIFLGLATRILECRHCGKPLKAIWSEA